MIVHIRHNQNRFTVSIESLSANVSELKRLILLQTPEAGANIRLIFRGRVLENGRPCETYGISDGSIVHVVSSSTSGGNSVNSSSEIGALPPIGADPSNPAAAGNILNSPLVQNLFNDPEMMRGLINNNPALSELMERNPQIRHVLDDPELMRRSMQMMNDPGAMQNMMRQNDLAMSQIENLPGGFNALRRMYEDVQEPLMEAVSSSSSSVPSQDNTNNNNNSSSSDGGAGPMPNPWGSSQSSRSPSDTSNVGSPPFALPNLWNNMGPGDNSTRSNPMSMMPNIPGMLNPNNPNSNTPNPEALLSLLESNPSIQPMMQSMLSDPNVMRNIIQSNPMMQQMMDQNPAMANMLSNPEFTRQMVNPENIRAMMQLQGTMGNIGMGGTGANDVGGGGGGGVGAGAGVGFGVSNPWATITPQATNTALPTPAATNDSGLDFSSLFINPGSTPTVAPPRPPPSIPLPSERRFERQLQSLVEMGFTDTNANIAALEATGGNVNRAIERLLS